jgi:hypothetical protein
MYKIDPTEITVNLCTKVYKINAIISLTLSAANKYPTFLFPTGCLIIIVPITEVSKVKSLSHA